LCAVSFVYLASGCAFSDAERPALTAELPLHLEEHLDAARVTGSEIPADPPQPVEWRFDEPQPDWKATPAWNAPYATVDLAATGEGLRITLTDATDVGPFLRGGIHVRLPDSNGDDWGAVVIRARADSASSVNVMGLGFNVRERNETDTRIRTPFETGGPESPIVRDGTIQTYRLILKSGVRDVYLFIGSEGEAGSIDILSISLIPTDGEYSEASLGTGEEVRNHVYRSSIYTHAPSRLEYRVRIDEGARLDVGLGMLREDAPVTFRITASHGRDTELLFEETYASKDGWAQRSVDLSGLAGQTVNSCAGEHRRTPRRVQDE
jgi:hypothetical protein